MKRDITPIIFVRIASMHYYKGVTKKDIPHGGGSFVDKYHDGGEVYNFAPTSVRGEDVCLGYVMLTTSSRTKLPELHLERIHGCKACNNEEKIEGVTVVFCAGEPHSCNMRVVGFYRNATVYRFVQTETLGENSYQDYSFLAKADNCVLIPYHDRYTDKRWIVPFSGKAGYDFGFGRSNLWYCDKVDENPKAMDYLMNMIDSIASYDGPNDI